MNEFDIKASVWDQNPMHVERSTSIGGEMIRRIPLNKTMRALEFGAGTGITSFLLKDHLKEIIMMDSSAEMVRVMNKKILSSEASNLRAIHLDLVHDQYYEGTFDLIFAQMSLHHVDDIEQIIEKFSGLINPGGYIAVADLYPEDGSFHGAGFSGHKGFGIDELSSILAGKGFTDIKAETCFTIHKKYSEEKEKNFDIFLLTARKV